MECQKCGSDKEGDQFYRYDKTCKECRKRLVRENRDKNAEYYREYDKTRYRSDPRVKARLAKYAKTEKGKEAANKARLKWYSKNPVKRLAANIVNNAVRDGKIVKPTACSKCGKSGRIHGHHDDYAFPLVVRWLCSMCHVDWHAQNGEGKNSN